jgi:DNA polymerase-3 subunit delta
MKRAEFLKQVAEKRLLPVYLFLGDEILFQDELFRAALNSLLPPEEQQFNFVRFSAAAVEPETFLANLETPSFFAPIRVIHLVEAESASAALEEAILKGLGRLADGVYLFIAAAKLDGRKKHHQEMQKRINVVDCNKVAIAEVPAWIKQTAAELDLKLTPEQIRVIAGRLGTELLRIRTELEKIRTFAGNSGKISDSDLDDLLPAEPEPNIFGLIDAVAERNPRLGLPRLEDLLNSGEPELKILATLARQFRNVVAAFEARKQGMSQRELASFLGINPYVAEKSFIQSGRFSLPELQQVINRLLWADYRIKSGQREPRLELELAVVEICSVGKNYQP